MRALGIILQVFVAKTTKKFPFDRDREGKRRLEHLLDTGSGKKLGMKNDLIKSTIELN